MFGLFSGYNGKKNTPSQGAGTIRQIICVLFSGVQNATQLPGVYFRDDNAFKIKVKENHSKHKMVALGRYTHAGQVVEK